LVLVSALGAQAQDEDEDDYEYYFAKESSGYMELYAGGGYFKINGSDGGDDGTGGAGVTVGGHLTENFAMDVTYEFQSRSKTSLAHYALKYVFRPEERFQPYLKAGIGLMGGRPNHAFLFMGRFDGGVSYFIDEQLAVRAGVGYAVAPHSNHLFLGNVGLVYYLE
jgi:hypothetical protein